MPRIVDPDSFGFLAADITRLVRAEMDVRVSAAGLGVTPGEARVLAHAARAGSVRQNALAERIGIEAMTLSDYVERLEGRGLVRRAVDPTDRRAKLVEVTDAADAVLAAMRAISADIRSEVSRTMKPEQWDQLMGLLKTARANLSGMRSAAAGAAESDAA